MIADVHADAIATFWDDGSLQLGSKADIPDVGTRYDADKVWFHIDNDSYVAQLPAGYEFVAPAGAAVWMIPETQAPGQLWAGFSTESVPAGTLDNDDTTLTLVDVEGPGDVEVWQGGALGQQVRRLWSSDEDVKSFTLGRVHMHANWAFTAPGSYDLTVRAGAAVGAAPVSDTATYTFIVGDAPVQVATTTSVSASATTLTAGDSVTLTANVVPASVSGYLEFRDNGNVIGHAPVVAGSASMVTTPAVGSHSMTARFVPAVSNLAATSTSDPVTVQVTDPSGVPFTVELDKASYVGGETMTATMKGFTLSEGQNVTWSIRGTGGGSGIAFSGLGPDAATGTAVYRVEASDNTREIRANVRQGTTVISSTPWVRLNVANAVPAIQGQFIGDGRNLYMGDDIKIQLTDNRALEEGETMRLARLAAASSGRWGASGFGMGLDGDVLSVEPPDANFTGYASYALQIVKNGIVIAQSDVFRGEIKWNHAVVSGLQPVYRAGSSFDLTLDEFYPNTDNLTHFAWTIRPSASNTSSKVVLAESDNIEDVRHLRYENIPAEWNNWHLDFDAYRTYAHSGRTVQVNDFFRPLVRSLQVRQLNPDEQLLFLRALPDHYHTGNTVKFDLVADPTLATEDTVRWEWKWPGSEQWYDMGLTGVYHEYTAEQGLNGAQVRAEVTFGNGERMITDPVTIVIDDHGGASGRRPTVVGATNHQVGDQVTLRAEVQGAPTALTQFRWFRQRTGETEPSVMPGENGASLSFTASAADDGARYRVAVITPAGRIAYDPANTLTLSVRPAADPKPTVTVTGLADRYDSGDAVTLTATTDPAHGDARYEWATRAAGASEWSVVPNITGPYRFTATAEMDGLEIVVRVYDGDTLLAESAPVTVRVTNGGGEPEPPSGASQNIVATIDDSAGALVMSVDPDDREVNLPAMTLATDGTSWAASGQLRPVLVTDTRSGSPGWSVSGQSSGFAATNASFSGRYLGWVPTVTAQATGGGVEPGAPVPTGFPDGDGLSVSRLLAIATPGEGLGSTRLAATLELRVPTHTEAGVYRATLTFTAI
ncbi:MULTISPECIES: choice-of-anchor M domain-containing protein [unclassified Micromonospora]|uniref:choice-of-anchor M domain-containing protein n=1 Tax=unclassified Micromonospora TaxID=2617518 RepID=UPI0022B74194|nr:MULTISPECIES: choice-of-anchor M domain-containing protein [unclassified Micromonospora]MCZ7418696.1 choice-of-anchor M domain-containing protein [Verrucosispora sp. WMMA2121]WBB92398.1 choice-of-anchor M domain-containing protein [Verrucosispora sp. WMMC514]